MKKIGFIGLGSMGQPMARNLLAAGFPLTIYDVREKPLKELAKQGAKVASSSREVGQNSDVVIVMLPLSPHSPVLEKEILEENGVLEGMEKGGIIIDGGNTSPLTTKKIAKIVQERGLRWLDAPVSGGFKGATEGTLAIMVGGDKKTFQACLAILRTIGKKIIYVGQSGMGQTVKLVNNTIVHTTCALVSEAISLGVKAGADPEAMVDAISAGAAQSWVLDNFVPSILDGRIHAGPGLAPTVSQLGYALKLADELNVPLLITSLAHEVYKVADAMGIGKQKDQSSIIGLWEKLAGIEVRKKKEKS